MSKATKSKLDAYQDKLEVWFGMENKTLAEVRELLRAEGCSVSLSRLSDWWERRQGTLAEEKLLQSIATGASLCRKLDAEMGANPPPELDTIMRLNRVLIMSLSTTGQANPEHLEMADRMTRTVLDHARTTMKARELTLAENKFQFDAAKAALAVLPELNAIKRDTSLTEDAKLEQARLKLFGTLPANKTAEPTR